MEEGRFVLCETGGTEHGGEEFPLFEDIDALLELVDDKAVGLIDLDLLQAV